MRVAIIGGGAAGFFTAIQLKEKFSDKVEVVIFEKSNKVLEKVRLSGGGRCNCSNTFENVRDLKEVYPRGHQLMKKALKRFGSKEVFQWFVAHGIDLKVEDKGRVFPKSNNSMEIVNLFLHLANKYNIVIKTNTPINSLTGLKKFDAIVLATGGYNNETLFKELESKGQKIKPFIPSLFSFNIEDEGLRELSGLVVKDAEILLCSTKFKYKDDLLITHWGVSGPATLKLSSFGAEYLYNNHYQSELLINWSGKTYTQVQQIIEEKLITNANKLIKNFNPLSLPNNLWEYLGAKALGKKFENKVVSINQKDINRITNILCSDKYFIKGRYKEKSEFVSCGGIALEGIDTLTMESKVIKNLYFVGEALDIDAITGGFNLQATWTTASLCSIS
ncbi:MAG: aminoacetone oxidase family FAD-binding enzyme [Bacteroidota bacterium]|nr:aminoacetone oxidase family FAD-binding enzyme [Bacteroidota bacterium]